MTPFAHKDMRFLTNSFFNIVLEVATLQLCCELHCLLFFSIFYCTLIKVHVARM